MPATHGPPRISGDLDDHGGNAKADQRVGDRYAEGDDDRAGDHGEARAIRAVRAGQGDHLERQILSGRYQPG